MLGASNKVRAEFFQKSDVIIPVTLLVAVTHKLLLGEAGSKLGCTLLIVEFARILPGRT